jgi:hypothetical protein
VVEHFGETESNKFIHCGWFEDVNVDPSMSIYTGLTYYTAFGFEQSLESHPKQVIGHRFAW